MPIICAIRSVGVQESKMTRIEVSVDIAAAPTSVFRLIHDLDRRPDWDERVVGLRMITPAPVRRGSLIQVDAGRAGRFLFTWEAEYTDYQMPNGSTLKVLDAAPSSPFKSGAETWQLSRSGDGTRLTLIWGYQPRGIIARISDRLGRRAATRRAMRRSLEKLKALVESG
jgi:uncharacterized protein YndB with AHSA1/START domain